MFQSHQSLKNRCSHIERGQNRMNKINLYPTFINWPFLIGGCLIGFYVEYEIGGIPFGLLFALMIITYEGVRVTRILKHLESDVTLHLVRNYYSRDSARKWIPWRDQAQGINAMLKKSL